MKVDSIIEKYQSMNPKRQRGVNVHKMKKTPLVRLVQTTEGNAPCFKSDISGVCGQVDCLWFKDCKDNRK